MRRIGGNAWHLTRRIPHVSLLSAAILSVSGCVTYHAAPLDPQASQQSFERASLDDPGIRQVAERPRPATQTTTRESDPTWDLDSLTRAALHLHPDITVARAHMAAVRAGARHRRRTTQSDSQPGAGVHVQSRRNFAVGSGNLSGHPHRDGGKTADPHRAGRGVDQRSRVRTGRSCVEDSEPAAGCAGGVSSEP